MNQRLIFRSQPRQLGYSLHAGLKYLGIHFYGLARIAQVITNYAEWLWIKLKFMSNSNAVEKCLPLGKNILIKTILREALLACHRRHHIRGSLVGPEAKIFEDRTGSGDRRGYPLFAGNLVLDHGRTVNHT